MKTTNNQDIIGKLIKTNYEYLFLVNDKPFASTDHNESTSYILNRDNCEMIIAKHEAEVLLSQLEIETSTHPKLIDNLKLCIQTMFGKIGRESFTKNQLSLAIKEAREKPKLSENEIVTNVIEFGKFQTSCEVIATVKTLTDANQCDGCNSGAELDEYNTHLHPVTKKAYMNCQKSRYNSIVYDSIGCIILV